MIVKKVKMIALFYFLHPNLPFSSSIFEKLNFLLLLLKIIT